MDIFGRCNGSGGIASIAGSGAVTASLISGGRLVTGTGNVTGTITNTGTRSGNETTVAAASAGAGTRSSSGPGSGGGSGSATGSARMQLTGASAPGAAASPESGVSPLADAYTKMTSDILTERTLGDFVSEHPGELVKTGESKNRQKMFAVSSISFQNHLKKLDHFYFETKVPSKMAFQKYLTRSYVSRIATPRLHCFAAPLEVQQDPSCRFQGGRTGGCG